MPTQNIKHRMLMDAKKIASTKFKDRFEVIRDNNFSIVGHSSTPASIVEKEEIDKILEEHPEYNGTEFRNMIRKAKEILKEKEREFNGQ